MKDAKAIILIFVGLSACVATMKLTSTSPPGTRLQTGEDPINNLVVNRLISELGKGYGWTKEGWDYYPPNEIEKEMIARRHEYDWLTGSAFILICLLMAAIVLYWIIQLENKWAWAIGLSIYVLTISWCNLWV